MFKCHFYESKTCFINVSPANVSKSIIQILKHNRTTEIGPRKQGQKLTFATPLSLWPIPNAHKLFYIHWGKNIWSSHELSEKPSWNQPKMVGSFELVFQPVIKPGFNLFFSWPGWETSVTSLPSMGEQLRPANLAGFRTFFIAELDGLSLQHVIFSSESHLNHVLISHS